MLDINMLRKTPEIVRENIKKKFQDDKLVLVDEVIDLDRKNREAMQKADALRNQRKVISKQIGGLMKQGKQEEAEAAKAQVAAIADELAQLAGKLRDMGENVAYDQVMLAVSDFEKGNMRLSTVLAALNV